MKKNIIRYSIFLLLLIFFISFIWILSYRECTIGTIIAIEDEGYQTLAVYSFSERSNKRPIPPKLMGGGLRYDVKIGDNYCVKYSKYFPFFNKIYFDCKDCPKNEDFLDPLIAQFF
jgi:hypothetical protein